MADINMDEINIEIESASTEATQGIQSLVATLTSLNNILNTTAQSANKFTQNISNLVSSTKKMKNIDSSSFNIFDKIKEKFSNFKLPKLNLSSEIEKEVNKVKVPKINIFDKIKEKFSNFKMPKFENPFKNFKMPTFKNPFKNIKRDEQDSGESAKDVANKFEKLQSVIGKVSNRLKEMVQKLTQFKLARTGLKAFNVMFGDLGGKVANAGSQFNRFIKNLSKYTFALYGIRSAFYAVRNTSNEFLSSQDKVAKQLNANISYLKYSVGSMFAPIIEYLTNLMYKILQIIQYIVYYFTKINIFAGKSASSYAAMENSSKGTTKELQKQLQSFDELNNINLEKNDSSGSSGSAIPTPTIDLSKIDNNIAAAFGDITNWGKALAEKINNALYSIKWDIIISGAQKAAESLANIFNDFTYWLDWEEVGNALAQGINTAITFVDTFYQNYSWTTLGTNLAKGLNNAFANIQWDKLGRTLTDRFKATVLTLEAFVTEFKWIDFGKDIGNMLLSGFRNIPWDSLANTINTGITGIFDSIDSFLDSIPWDEVGQTIGKCLNDINWGEIIKRLFTTIGKIGKALVTTLWNTIFSGNETQILAALIGSFIALKSAIKGISIITKVADGFSKFTKAGEGVSKVTTLMLGLGKGITGVGAILGGTTLGITNFVSMWKNGVTAIKAVLAVLGVAIAAVGAVILGVSAPVAAVVAAVTVAVGAVALLTKAFVSNKAAIKDTEQAQEDYNNAVQESAEATQTYEDAIDTLTSAQDSLKQAEDETGLSGQALYEQVENGTLTYANMTAQQREVYKAYKKVKDAQDEATEATNKMTEAKKKEVTEGLENQLSLAKESGNYDEYKKAVVDAYQKGEISADEAREYIERAMSKMSKSSAQTFGEDLPEDVKNGLNPDEYKSPAQKFGSWFKGIWEGLKNFVGNWWNNYVKVWFTWAKWQELINNIKERFKERFRQFIFGLNFLQEWFDRYVRPWFSWSTWWNAARDAVRGIQDSFSNMNIRLKLPHFYWTSQPASGWISRTLEALNLPSSLPKLNVSWYANGGFPDEGELFVSREAGPEYVGTIGNKTAVANNDQITTSIYQAAYQAMSQALNENADSDQPINVYVGNEKLYSGYANYQSQASNQYGVVV